MGRRAGIVFFGAAVEPHELLGPADAESRDERILDDLPGHAQGFLEVLRQALDEDDGVILQADEAHPRRLGHEVPDLPLVGDLEGQARRHGRQAVETAGDRGLAARDDEPDDGHGRCPVPVVDARDARLQDRLFGPVRARERDRPARTPGRGQQKKGQNERASPDDDAAPAAHFLPSFRGTTETPANSARPRYFDAALRRSPESTRPISSR